MMSRATRAAFSSPYLGRILRYSLYGSSMKSIQPRV